MYTRDFGAADTETAIPEAYCGNLFSEEKRVLHNDEETEEKEDHGILSVFRAFKEKPFDFKKLPFFKKGFGTEELILLGIAAFLFFSKDGDKECALILILTLFLN